MTGRFNFMERDWGGVEPFDLTLPELLKQNGIFSHITTDHNHYFEIGGEGYCQLFSSWDLHRGQEFDPWVSRVDQPALPDHYYGKASVQYEMNRTRMREDKDFSTPRTIASACQWLKDNKNADNYYLQVETFDPHEPFDVPDVYLNLYNDDYKGPRYDWSSYDKVHEPVEAIEYLSKRYAATLTMTDKWLGKLFDQLKENGDYDDTMIILTADHGHLLGEHDWTGKNLMPAYNELSHIPLIIRQPGGMGRGERISALTQNIDMMPTLLDYFGIEKPGNLHGKSWIPLLSGEAESIRDYALFGWFGMAVNITDGRFTYFKAPARDDNYPLNFYGSLMTTLWRYLGRDDADKLEMGRFLSWTDYPVYKLPFAEKGIGAVRENLLFNIGEDYKQEHPLENKEIEERMTRALIRCMKESDSPEEQFERLGLVL
jgi:arylsulfatase A-like enzyme